MIRTAAFLTLAALAGPAFAQDASPHAHHHGAPPPQTAEAAPHATHEDHAMRGVLGAYPMAREASGTSWQPDASVHGGVHGMWGEWSLMGHALLNGVWTRQSGPRGDERAFAAGMIMGAARRDFANGDALNLRAMLSPDPLMGAEGYPLLFAAGETADGATTLVDRQHPHDLFVELSASYAHQLGARDSVFLYAGLPGEPAFGPPVFMHRLSGMDFPEAPITHHWLDSTHVTFGVLTAGYVHGDVKIEASRFRGREPDEQRTDIETGALDSMAVRVSWNPTPNWALQASWADIHSPEALEPDEDETRYALSAIYTRPLGDGGWLTVTAAAALKERSDGASLDAWLLEGALRPNLRWTIFARLEHLETDELGLVPHGPSERVTRASLGAVRDWRVGAHAALGLGFAGNLSLPSDALAASYDGDEAGGMAFIRLRID